ncbi:inactive hydroxysteroid dehydrogenase-like protein 1 [Ischnura elegans]|uniref:inactive hydroxysteroid dehydrogenase-like protein 1 n=1 Tax=Ischnura elegans TaxID=197161 RepID=UPI001ED87BB7|nr:inactive hydroxysteroid dehydrogenase-like protein 1 [Ischnura elegans]
MALTSDSPLLLVREMTKTAMMCDEFFTVVGYFYVGKVLLSLTITIFKEIKVRVYSAFFPVNLAAKYGKWAVITGATDGIGKAYAQEFARRGLSIYLISRNPVKLTRVANEIESEYGVTTRTLAVDFSEGRSVYDRIAKALEEIQVGILVNNVGFLSERAGPVAYMTENDMWTVINLNCGAATLMSKLVLPSMIEAKKGAIVNISSVAGMHPLPWLAVYSSSKAYLYYLSEALRTECRSSGITIQTVTPGYVKTNLISKATLLSQGGISIPSPRRYARHAVATLGVVDTTCGYWIHEFQLWFTNLFPRAIISELCLHVQKYVYKDASA